MTARRDLLSLFSQSAGDWLDGWFESDPIKAVFGFDGIVGAYASPYTPGTAYVLLHHVFGEVNGVRGAWGHAIGGMGAISQAMAAACAEQGVELVTGTSVSELIVEIRPSGRRGRRRRGRSRRAKVVASNVHPKLLFETLLDPALLPADFRERMTRYRSGSGVFRMNVALSELPRFTCLPEAGDHLTAGIILAPSLGYMDRAFLDARLHGWSREPIVEMMIPSTLDDTLAPPGQHVAEPLLPARGAHPRWPVLGRLSRRGRRPDDRDGRPRRAGLRRLGDRPQGRSPRSISNAPSASSAATSSTANSNWISCFPPGRCWVTGPTARRSPASTCAGREPTPAAASPERPEETPRAKS